MASDGQAKDLANVFRGLSHPARIALIQQLDNKSVAQIARENEMKLPAMQRHLENLKELKLIERKGNRYRLTALGQSVSQLVKQFEQDLPSLKNVVKERSMKNVRQSLVKFGSGLSKQEIMRIVNELPSNKT
jgi:predicted transcriptional regulator